MEIKKLAKCLAHIKLKLEVTGCIIACDSEIGVKGAMQY